MSFDTSRKLKFIPYNDAHLIADNELLVVDCYYPRGLNLTHLYSERVPKAFRSDTSTETVIKWIEDTNNQFKPKYVTCNHWDIDGFLSVWCALNPELALKYKDLLIKTATLGDFRECDRSSEAGLNALKLCAILNHEEREYFCLPFGDLEDATIEYEISAQKFPYFIPRFTEWLERTDDFRNLWHEEYTQVLDDMLFIDEGYAHFEELEQTGLSIVTSSKPLHYYAAFSQAKGGAVLTYLPEHHYIELEYKYETAVGRLGKKIITRTDLSSLAKKLTSLEVNPDIIWCFDNINEGGTMLRPEKEGFPVSREMRYQNLAARLLMPEPPYTTLSDEIVIGKIIEALTKTKENYASASAGSC